ncbi:MAG: thiamine pyrophosphate-dependent enzyme [Chloroflexi bacterium]|nr:thiamine pyrophosphate-dependent enzyme [Chloroflexota bacterium]
MAELETAVREGINVITILFKDFGYGSMRKRQRAVYGGRITGTRFNNPDFARLAQDLGAYGERVTEPEDLAAALPRGIESGKPAVLDVYVAD